MSNMQQCRISIFNSINLSYSHTQPGHKLYLMRVNMGRNSPRRDGNLHTVTLETAIYGYCKSWSPEYEKDKSRCCSKRVNTVLTESHKLLFYVCRCWLTRVGTCESGIRYRSMRVDRGQNVYYEACIQGM
jgi:hypothetical protein